MQGFNMGRYVPPDQEGILNANQASGKGHALGARASKISQGILTVRFEMPFPIWCTTCTKPTIIGQGVRFNAEKKKIGNYHSTPIYAFRMKHSVCGGTLEIRTDPQNTAYVVTEGAKKRDTGEDRLREGEIVIAGAKTEEERERLANDPFASLEEKVGDKRQAATEKARIEELYRANDSTWEDPGEANRRLRRGFRAERKVRARQAEATEALQERMGLGMELLEETEGDRRGAGNVEFGEVGRDVALVKAQSKPLFSRGDEEVKKPPAKTKKKSAKATGEEKREALRKELGQNTRAILDPFLSGQKTRSAPQMPLIKRKRPISPGDMSEPIPPREEPTAQKTMGTMPLVDYDSD